MARMKVAAEGRDRCLRRIRGSVGIAVLAALAGCDGLLKSDELPPQVVDPAITRTRQGALNAYNAAIAQFRAAFGGIDRDGDTRAAFVANSGMLSDELQTTLLGLFGSSNSEDSRTLPEEAGGSFETTFSRLQRTRGQTGQAIGLLNTYVPETPALRSHMYALQAYAEIFLAEHFCSGIPLSTLDYDGDYTLRPGSTTDSVFKHAIALFDSTLALAGDSAAFTYLARVGQARALLNLGQYEAAAAAAGPVPDGYSYAALYGAASPTLLADNFSAIGGAAGTPWELTVADREGTNGLDYRSSNDPRTRATARGTIAETGLTIWHPNKYMTGPGTAASATTGATPIVVASGVEARLIEAEAALRANPDASVWLDKLNVLRTAGLETIPAETLRDTLGLTGCSAAQKCGTDGVSGGTFRVPDLYVLTDSVTITLTAAQKTRCLNSSSYAPCLETPATALVRLYVRTERWSAGSGGYTDLPLLADPGTATGRVDLLFRERAFWLFLTGHRQGDLRRLIRQYERRQDQVYPIGAYPAKPGYGTDVTVPVPAAERASNPHFTGCISRNA